MLFAIVCCVLGVDYVCFLCGRRVVWCVVGWLLFNVGCSLCVMYWLALVVGRCCLSLISAVLC